MNTVWFKFMLTCCIVGVAVFVSPIASDEESLQRAYNNVVNRQRQIGQDYYSEGNKVAPNYNEEEFMDLHHPLPRFRGGHRHSNGYGYTKHNLGKNVDLIDDGISQEREFGNYEDRTKNLNTRLNDKLWLDYMHGIEQPTFGTANNNYGNKRSVFREREELIPPESLQTAYAYPSEDEYPYNAYLPPASQFRERSKPRLLGEKFDGKNSDYIAEDVLLALNSLLRKTGGRDEQMSPQDIEEILKYFKERSDEPQGDYYPNSIVSPFEKKLYNDDGNDKLVYLAKDQSNEDGPNFNKRYWMGSKESFPYAWVPNQKEITVKKRSPDLRDSKSKTPKKATSEFLKTKNLTSILKPGNDSDFHHHHATENQKFIKVLPKDMNGTFIKYNSSTVPLNISKKSVDWSNYFGMDKKDGESVFRDRNKILLGQNSGYGGFNVFKRGEESKIVDENLINAQDKIFDNIIKNAGANTGNSNADDMQHLKDYIKTNTISALELEKLRREIARGIGLDVPYDQPPSSLFKKMTPEDFVSEHQNVGLNKVAPDGEHNHDGIQKKPKFSAPSTTLEGYDESGAKWMNGPVSTENFEELAGRDISTNEILEECAVLLDIMKKCEDIVDHAGARNNAFMTLCTIHQICYVCSDKEIDEEKCDENYKMGAEIICANEPRCLYSAKAIYRSMFEMKKAFEVDTCDQCLLTSVKKLMDPEDGNFSY